MAVSIPVVALCLIFVTVPGLWAARVTLDDTQANGNFDVISVLVNQVHDLKAVVTAQSEELRELKAETKANNGKLQSQGEEIQDLKTIEKAQSEEVSDLRALVDKQRELILTLVDGGNGNHELVHDPDNALQDGKLSEGESHSNTSPNLSDKNIAGRYNESVKSPHRTSEGGVGIKSGSELTQLTLKKSSGTRDAVSLQQDGVKGGKLSRGIREAPGVAFSAVLNHDINDMSLEHVIKPQNVLLNDGNAYNTHTGAFTAPATGVYFFIYFIEDYRSGDQAGIRLVVDDVHEVDAYVYPNNGHGVMGGNSAILRVNAGQTVWLQTYQYKGADLHSTDIERLVTFSGFQIY